jgi:hypothetical protein
MKRILKLLLIAHVLKQFLGLKSQDDNIIKIWYDIETQSTCLFLKGRHGLWVMPEKEKCQSKWLVSLYHMNKYGFLGNRKHSTIFTLIEVVKSS